MLRVHTYRGINDAFRGLISKGGTTGPSSIVYSEPWQRVLLNKARDIDPFFNLYRSLHTLAGRRDAEPLAWYNREFRGCCYGHRWRHASADTGQRSPGDEYSRMDPRTDVDQIKVIVELLKSDPSTQRAVLRTWDVEEDLLGAGTCRNMEVVFRTVAGLLNMTVIDRSSDLVQDALGEDYVLFTVLQEYVAASVGAGMGEYLSFSNNLRVHLERQDSDRWLAEPAAILGSPFSLVQDPRLFDLELVSFVGNAYGPGIVETLGRRVWGEPFLELVAKPMVCAFASYREDRLDRVIFWLNRVADPDWARACTWWMEKRYEPRELS